MVKFRPRFRDRPLREMRLQLSLAGALVVVLSVVLAWKLLPPPLPNVVRLGAGPADGYYAHFGAELREAVAVHHIDVELVETSGSMDNIRRLQAGEIDVALVQSGNLGAEQREELASVAAVFYELVLVVERDGWSADNIDGGRIVVGRPGSGGHQLARRLLADQGIEDGVPSGTQLVEIGGDAAVDALLEGRVDSGILVGTIDDDWLPPLFADPRVQVENLRLATAFTRHYRFLRRLVIPAGLLDLDTEIPSEDVEVIAATTSLVIGPHTHHALVPLLIESTQRQLREGSLLAAPGIFPSASGVDAPLAEEAVAYFDRGPPLLYRWLPFRWAYAATRIAVLLIPFVTILYPLFRSVKPAYLWAVERRVYRWYRELKPLERRIDAANDPETLQIIRKELEQTGAEIRATVIPSRYASKLFALRAHHAQLVARLDEAEERVRGSSG